MWLSPSRFWFCSTVCGVSYGPAVPGRRSQNSEDAAELLDVIFPRKQRRRVQQLSKDAAHRPASQKPRQSTAAPCCIFLITAWTKTQNQNQLQNVLPQVYSLVVFPGSVEQLWGSVPPVHTERRNGSSGSRIQQQNRYRSKRVKYKKRTRLRAGRRNINNPTSEEGIEGHKERGGASATHLVATWWLYSLSPWLLNSRAKPKSATFR